MIVLHGFSLEYGGLEIETDELFVTAEFRSPGLGRAILEFIEAEARKFGAILLTLETESDNEKAQEF